MRSVSLVGVSDVVGQSNFIADSCMIREFIVDDRNRMKVAKHWRVPIGIEIFILVMTSNLI